MTNGENKMHTQILNALKVIVDEIDGEVSYSVDNVSDKEIFSKNVSRTTIIEIRIKRSI
jgi:hypothetical protein